MPIPTLTANPLALREALYRINEREYRAAERERRARIRRARATAPWWRRWLGLSLPRCRHERQVRLGPCEVVVSNPAQP